jgi:hypothetical protein
MTLKEQYNNLPNKSAAEIIQTMCTNLGIREHVGGPEGKYYTHPLVNGEFLYRHLGWLIARANFEQSLL